MPLTIKDKYIAEWEKDAGEKMSAADFDYHEYADWLEIEHEHLQKAVKELAAKVA